MARIDSPAAFLGEPKFLLLLGRVADLMEHIPFSRLTAKGSNHGSFILKQKGAGRPGKTARTC